MEAVLSPYEGQEPYIFFSYSHANQDVADEILLRLFQDGYRVWFDEGIHPGADWPEVIAQHLEKCAVGIALVTEESAQSHNCRNEINFLIEERKKLIPILWTDFPMSAGMKLQLGSTQFIQRFKFGNDALFFSKLYQSDGLAPCKGAIPSRVIRKPEPINTPPDASKERFPENEGVAGQKSTKTETIKLQQETESLHPAFINENRQLPDADASFNCETVRFNTAARAEEQDIRISPIIISLSDGKVYPIYDSSVILGRNIHADICIVNEKISNFHARLDKSNDGFWYLSDLDSLNGTFLEGERIQKEHPVRPDNPFWMELADTAFLFAEGSLAGQIQYEGCISFLQCEETGEKLLLDRPGFLLGRKYIWKHGTMGDPRIGRMHAILTKIDGSWLMEVGETRNGTFFNHYRIATGEKGVLKDGDRIGLGNSYHVCYHQIFLHRDGKNGQGIG